MQEQNTCNGQAQGIRSLFHSHTAGAAHVSSLRSSTLRLCFLRLARHPSPTRGDSDFAIGSRDSSTTPSLAGLRSNVCRLVPPRAAHTASCEHTTRTPHNILPHVMRTSLHDADSWHSHASATDSPLIFCEMRDKLPLSTTHTLPPSYANCLAIRSYRGTAVVSP